LKHFDRVPSRRGFTSLGGQPCTYILRMSVGGFMLVALHVDD
jgi:hypothetical protein